MNLFTIFSFLFYVIFLRSFLFYIFILLLLFNLESNKTHVFHARAYFIWYIINYAGNINCRPFLYNFVSKILIEGVWTRILNPILEDG